MTLDAFVSNDFSNFIMYETTLENSTSFNSSSDNYSCNGNLGLHGPLNSLSSTPKTIQGTSNSTTTTTTRVRKRCRRPKTRKNKEEAETQRLTHIVVERNRRKQMNEYLAVLRSLMPESYAHKAVLFFMFLFFSSTLARPIPNPPPLPITPSLAAPPPPILHPSGLPDFPPRPFVPDWITAVYTAVVALASLFAISGYNVKSLWSKKEERDEHAHLQELQVQQELRALVQQELQEHREQQLRLVHLQEQQMQQELQVHVQLQEWQERHLHLQEQQMQQERQVHVQLQEWQERHLHLQEQQMQQERQVHVQLQEWQERQLHLLERLERKMILHRGWLSD